MKHVAKRHEKKLHIEKKEENLPIPKNLMGHFLDYETDVNESGRFPCTFCSKIFSLKHVAKRHEMSHTKEGSVTSLLKHSIAHPTKCLFLSKKLIPSFLKIKLRRLE